MGKGHAGIARHLARRNMTLHLKLQVLLLCHRMLLRGRVQAGKPLAGGEEMSQHEDKSRAVPDVRAVSINVTLWLNSKTQDWSLMLNDTIHRHVSFDIVESLVESSLIVAEASLYANIV